MVLLSMFVQDITPCASRARLEDSKAQWSSINYVINFEKCYILLHRGRKSKLDTLLSVTELRTEEKIITVL